MTERLDHTARDHLALALDVGDLDAALAVAAQVQRWFGIAKVGVELYAEAGPDAFRALQDKGFRVFADLKLHDIPTTVNRAARVLGRAGVDFLNFHAAGGEEMVRAGVEGLAEGARDRGGPHAPVSLAVTVLTSDPNVDALEERLRVAAAAGCAGVVCAGADVERARAHALRTMVPGIRPAGSAHDDQARVDTPGDAIARGADWLVIGRAVTRADDPAAAAAAVLAEVDAALARG
jgi:orotidine-5'-phosphate decarboxylase